MAPHAPLVVKQVGARTTKGAPAMPSRWGPMIGHGCCGSWQYDRLTTGGWAQHFQTPTISIMSVLMYTEQQQSEGHGRGKHTCRKQTSDRIIKCCDWFGQLWAPSLYCVGGELPDCAGLCDGEASFISHPCVSRNAETNGNYTVVLISTWPCWLVELKI